MLWGGQDHICGRMTQMKSEPIDFSCHKEWLRTNQFTATRSVEETSKKIKHSNKRWKQRKKLICNSKRKKLKDTTSHQNCKIIASLQFVFLKLRGQKRKRKIIRGNLAVTNGFKRLPSLWGPRGGFAEGLVFMICVILFSKRSKYEWVNLYKWKNDWMKENTRRWFRLKWMP